MTKEELRGHPEVHLVEGVWRMAGLDVERMWAGMADWGVNSLFGYLRNQLYIHPKKEGYIRATVDIFDWSSSSEGNGYWIAMAHRCRDGYRPVPYIDQQGRRYVKGS